MSEQDLSVEISGPRPPRPENFVDGIPGIVYKTPLEGDEHYISAHKSNFVQELFGAAFVKFALFLDGSPNRLVPTSSLLKINKALNVVGLGMGEVSLENTNRFSQTEGRDGLYEAPVVGILNKNTRDVVTIGSESHTFYKPPSRDHSESWERKFKPLVKLTSPLIR